MTRGSRRWPLALLLWAFAFSCRLFLQLSNIDRAWPFPVFYEGDAETFYHYAQAILAGIPYDAGVPFHPPLFPYFLSFFHLLLGDPLPNLALRAILAAIYSLQVPLLYLLLRSYLGDAAALAGALLASASFGLSLVSIAAVSEGLYLVLLLSALLLLRRLRQSDPRADHVGAAGRRRLRAVGLGVLLGLCALTRAEGLVVAFALLFWGASSMLRGRGGRVTRALPEPPDRKSSGAALRIWGMAFGALLITLAPWTIRNAITMRAANRAVPDLAPLPTFVAVTAYGPLNFALANAPGLPGYFTRSVLPAASRGSVLDLRDPRQREIFLSGYRRGLAFITGHPAAFLALAGRKLAVLARALHLGWTQWDLPGGLRGTRYPVDVFTPDSSAAVFVHLALLLPGAWILWRRRDAAHEYLILTGILTGLTLLSTVLFFGYARQGVLMLPFLFGIEGATLAVLAEAAMRRTARGGRTRPRRVSGGQALAVAVLLLWGVELAGAFQNRNYIASGPTQEGSTMLNRDSVIRIFPVPE